MKKILLMLVCCVTIASQAQTVYKDQVRVENQTVTRAKENQLIVSMDVFLQQNMKISSNRAAMLTPLLKADGHVKSLPAIAVYGRRRAISTERTNKLPKDAYRLVRRKRKTEQKVDYLVQIPYEEWMQQSELSLSVDLCGCCNVIEEGKEDLLAKCDFRPMEPYQVKPSVAYIMPAAEAVKHRSIEGKAYLDFPVNQMTIDPTYRKNPNELAKICATIDTVKNDKNIQIIGIDIRGYASPEGKFAANARLAQGRSEALKQFVSKLYNFSSQIFTVSSTPEDWDGLRNYISLWDNKDKDALLDIVNKKGEDLDAKEYRLRTVAAGVPYAALLANCYPTLRHSDYVVRYVVRGFTTEEAKSIVETRPQLLSLQEMFNVAQTYEEGSDKFNQVFSAAALMYPEDPTANLNAASIKIIKKDYATAKKYLKKADQKLGATLNNLGIIAMVEGEWEQASSYFNQAKAAGILQAEENLKELEIASAEATK